MPFIFHRYSNLTRTAITPEITPKLIPVSARNEDFQSVCKNLHKAGIKVVLDGVFNHVGRGFWAFQDVLEKRWDSPYKDWFHISFDGNSNYNDGLWYEGWEGNYDLVKLNLRNEDVIQHIFFLHQRLG